MARLELGEFVHGAALSEEVEGEAGFVALLLGAFTCETLQLWDVADLHSHHTAGRRADLYNDKTDW